MLLRGHTRIFNSKTGVQLEELTLDTFKSKICDCGFDGGNTEWKYKGAVPAVIDFYADWCSPCKLIAPILEQLSKEYDGKISMYKVNTEKETELARAFGITSIPSILFVPLDGEPQMAAGALPKQEFKRAFKEVFGIEEKTQQ